MATVRCDEIAQEKYSSFVANEVRCFQSLLFLVSCFDITKLADLVYNIVGLV